MFSVTSLHSVLTTPTKGRACELRRWETFGFFYLSLRTCSQDLKCSTHYLDPTRLSARTMLFLDFKNKNISSEQTEETPPVVAPWLYLSLTDILALLTHDLVDNNAMVQAVDEVVAWRPHQGSLQSTEEDPVQFLHILLPHFLQEKPTGRSETLLCLAYGLKITRQR